MQLEISEYFQVIVLFSFEDILPRTICAGFS